jgi:hypothetical protein
MMPTMPLIVIIMMILGIILMMLVMNHDDDIDEIPSETTPHMSTH